MIASRKMLDNHCVSDSSAEQRAESAEWLTRLRSGDPIACRKLVNDEAPRMLSIARRFLDCEHDSADAVQDAFGSAFRSLDSFGGNSTVSTWLYRIVVNACLMKLRAKSRRRTTSLDEMLPAFDDGGRHAATVGRWDDSYTESDVDNEVRAMVRACMDRLPDDYRRVLVLRDVEEFDTEATAAILGLTATNVKVRLHRARQALRTLLLATLPAGPRQRAA